MGALKYLKGSLKNLFNPSTSLFVRIDDSSVVEKNAKVYGYVQVYQSCIGSYTYISNNTQIICANIGRYCSIADEVIIGPGIHTLNYLSTSPIFTESINALGLKWSNETSVEPFKPVRIGNDVWIGSRVIVMGGVTIGDGAVVGAGAIVTKDVPPYTIVAGVPAKPLRKRFSDDVIEKLLELKWWDMPEEKLKEHIALFQKEDATVEELERLLKAK